MPSMYRLLFLSLLVLTAACVRQTPAPVISRGDYFFGREGGFDSQGNAIPKYSPTNPAPTSEYNAEKYKGGEEQYSVAADVGPVTASDLPAPNATPAPAATPIITPAPTQEMLAPINGMAATPTTPAPTNSYVPLNTQQPVSVAVSSAPQNFVWPLKGKVISTFAQSHGPIAIAARTGEPIRAVADGVVSQTSSTKDGGYTAIIEHGNWTSSYGRAGDVVVKRGDKVVQGQLIGFVGKGANGAESQLSFGMTKDGQPVDPQGYLK